MNASTKPLGQRGWWAENWKPLAIVWILCLLPFLSTLFSGQILFSSDQQGAPAWNFYFSTLRSGEIPLWNPYALSGMPTFDTMFGDGSYPVFLLLGCILPVTYLVSCNFILHVLIAGTSTYILTQRYFKLNGWLAAALSVAYALNPHFIAYIYGGHTGKFHIRAWLPLSLFFLLRSLSPAATWKHMLGLSLTVALFVLTTHLQFTYFVMMGYFLVWLSYLVPLVWKKQIQAAAGLVVRFWVPILLGVGLAFFIFYPPLQYTKNFGIRGAAEKMTYEHATSWSMHPEETASLLVPEFGGLNENYWGRNYFKLNTEAPGVLLWFLGLLGLFALRGRWFWLWGSVGLLSILYGLADHTPVFRLFYELVPGIKNFRAASMMLFWLGAALLAMSGETLRRLLAPGPEGLTDARRQQIVKGLRYGAGGAAVLLVLCGLFPGMFYSIWDSMVDESAIPNLAHQAGAASAFALGSFRVAVLVAVLAWASITYLLRARRPLAFGLVALAVTAVDHYWVDSNFIQSSPVAQGFESNPAVDFMKADTSRFRVFDLPGVFQKGYAQYHGLEATGGWTDNEIRHYRALRGGDYTRDPYLLENMMQNPDGSLRGNPILNLLNVKYVAYRVPNNPTLNLALNSTVLPRAFFIPSWKAVSDSDALQGMRQPGFDPRRVAFVSGPGLVSGGTVPDSGAPLVVAAQTVRKNNRLTYVVDAPSRGVLFASELWFPHWRVKVDGKPAELLRTNFAFRGVFVEAGHHTVEYEYRSPWLRKGLFVAMASALLLALFLWGYEGLSMRRRLGGS